MTFQVVAVPQRTSCHQSNAGYGLRPAAAVRYHALTSPFPFPCLPYSRNKKMTPETDIAGPKDFEKSARAGCWRLKRLFPKWLQLTKSNDKIRWFQAIPLGA